MKKLLEGRRKQLDDEVKIRDLTARLVESSKSSKGDCSTDGEKSTETSEKRDETSDSAELPESRNDSEAGVKITDREAKLVGKHSSLKFIVHLF